MWGSPHDCPGPSGLTGTWIEYPCEGRDGYEVRFAFEGETVFDDVADAREACTEYERIVADGVHGDELRRLRAEAVRQEEHARHDRETLTQIENAFEAVGGDLVDEVLELRAEAERLRSELHATQKAKRENDDRFMRERDAARAEVERLRSGIAGLRAALLYGLKAGDGSEPEPTIEVSGVVACLDVITREDGEG